MIATIKLDKETQEKNDSISCENRSLLAESARLNATVDNLKQRKEDMNNSFAAEESLFNKNRENLKENFDLLATQLSEDYNKKKNEYENDYLSIIADLTQAIQDKLDEYLIQEEKLKDIKSKVDSAIAVNIREEEKKEKQDFYKLKISQLDINEIKILREACMMLRNTEPINKVIWKVYYENPTTDLVGRVVGSKQKTGIYKITNLSNQMCYVGQAVDIGARWKQHIKRGIGADAPTKNKLYPAMLEFGVENFSFEIIEECSNDKLNEREQYWQNFYKAKEFGYSIK